MRRSTFLPALAVTMVVLAVAAAGLIARTLNITTGRGASGAAAGSSSAAQKMAERWLRDDATTGVEIFPGAVPPALDYLLNGAVTNPADRMTVPTVPNARLVGSSFLKQPDGGDLVWLMYDVDGDVATVAQTVAGQMDKSPWQVTAQIAQETERVVQFQNTRLADVEGSVIVRVYPNSENYRLTVSRGGKETSLTVKLTALAPSLGAETQANLTVTRVDAGPAQAAGLQKGDQIVRVNDTAVKSPGELAAALQGAALSGSPRSSVMYVLQAKAPEPAVGAVSSFAPPRKPLALPQDFPAGQAWQGLTVLRYAYGQQQGGKAFRASMVSKDAAAAVASKVRDGLKAAGWQITQDQPQGFATQLQIANAAQGLAGQVAIDQFAQDSAYIQVVVQIQSGQAAGRP